MCPPDCCDTIYYYFTVGDSKCCNDTSLRALKPEPEVSYAFQGPLSTLNLPEFVKEEDRESEFVFALGASTSIPCPCVEVKVTVTISNCCIYQKMYAVGSGTVSASVNGGNECCGFTLKALINGEPSPVEVSDGDPISVSLAAEGEGNANCSICLTKVEDPCENSYGQQLFIVRKNTSGKYSLNVSTIGALQRINRLKKLQLHQRQARLKNQSKGFRPKKD